MKTHSDFTILLWLLILLVIAIWFEGCTMISPLGPSVLPLATVSNTNIYLPTKAIISSLVPSNTEIPTLMPTIIPASKLIPTPMGNDIKNKVAFLLETNGNCSLPCFWGITPGRTPWNIAESYLDTFALDIYSESPTLQDDLTIYKAKFPDPSVNYQDKYLFIDFAVTKSGMIEYILSPSRISIASTLDNTGVPTQVLVDIVTIGPGPIDYTLVLYYDNGIMMVYQGTTNSGDINFINICPSDIPKSSSQQLWVWDSAKISKFEDIGKFGLIAPLSPNRFRLLDDVSDMQSQSFFNNYKNPAATQCIKTPWSNWIK